MTQYDVIVVGGGISGASFAFHAARAGREVLVVEKAESAGGCLHSERLASGFWYELGAHTCYNSYGALLEILEECGLIGELLPRGKSVLRFLDGDRVIAGKNLGLFVKLFGKLEFLCALPRWIGARQEGESVRSHYSRLVGPRNYERVLGPMLSAVPSQTADEFPANMLFKKRERRKDVIRSFTLPGGLRSAVEAILGRPGIETLTGRVAVGLTRADDGFTVRLDDGTSLEGGAIAIATPPGVSAELLRDVVPEPAARMAEIREVRVDSLGLAVRADEVALPYATFLIPLRDTFHSIGTRDVVADPEWRAFSFHFRPGQTRDDRIGRAAAILGLRPADMEVIDRQRVLPSPVVGHAELVAAIDRGLAKERVALTGNWFTGLSIEDCVLRSRGEWERIAALEAE